MDAAGLPELVAHTPERFIAAAAALAGDRAGLAALSAGLRNRLLASDLCNGPAHAAAQPQRAADRLAALVRVDRVQARVRGGDPQHAAAVEGGAGRAAHLHAPQRAHRAEGDERDARARQRDGGERAVARHGQRAERGAVQGDGAQARQRGRVEHRQPVAGHGVDAAAARRDAQAADGDAEVGPHAEGPRVGIERDDLVARMGLKPWRMNKPDASQLG